MLRAHGHPLQEYRVHNDSVDGMSRLGLLTATMWNRASYRAIDEALTRSGSRIAHFHNTFPLISPAAYYAARRRRVPVVQTLHNYRLLCPEATLFREGRVCEECLGRAVPWPGIVHGCYRGSRATTAVVAGMVTFHRAIGTWRHQVDVYIALTQFARRKFIEGGLPEDRIVVKPNFAEDPGPGEHRSGGVLFVGRLVPEKGVETMMRAWELVVARRPDARLTIIGQGPLANRVDRGLPGLRWLRQLPREQVGQAMLDASALLFPSNYYEGFPMVIAESFASGLPVIAGRIGAAAELIRDGETGRFCQPGNPRDLADVLEQALSDPAALRAMGREARREYEAKYTPQVNYAQLMQVYALAAERAGF